MDVKTAFLNGDLDKEIYMEQPEGFSSPGQEKKVCKLVKSLYGLRQAPKQWHEKFNSVMMESGFKINECAAISWKSSKQTVIARSTMESEFIALEKSGEEAEWLRNLLEDILRWHNTIKQLLLTGVITIDYVKSKDNITDPLTKGTVQGHRVYWLASEINMFSQAKVQRVTPTYQFSLDGGVVQALVQFAEVVFAVLGSYCERSIKLSSPIAKPLKIRFKVIVPLEKIKRANESENAKKPRQKYV
ncbi:uncharacterized protein LOC111406426 [Olea europaea var. sylvestris]|uniref:uncharacterized protein LOC111406426 n=1 Tax=Olea europaea var. sylvestris TaxID=158386 RepID=UPI000C1CFEB7|nr:uncharacterized protein LOC111406426 [Olea europaea var. sylvestris]